MQLSMNNTVPEPDRSAEMLGFNNVPSMPSTAVPQGQGVQTLPHPATNEIVDHSNTIPYPANDGVPGVHRITEQL